MKRISLPLLLLFFMLAAAAAAALPARGQSGFIIENADATNTLSFTASTELDTLINQIAPRFVVEFAHANRHYTLTAIPATLNDLLVTLQPRFVMQFAHANRHIALTPVPAQLNTFLEQLLPRFTIQFAHANQEFTLHYPIALIGDTVSPQVSQVDVEGIGEDSAIVTWATDEYADSTVRCGTESDIYTMTFSDPLYVEQHAVTLTGLTPGTVYYCICSSTDMSGNTTHSQEFNFEQFAQPAATQTKRVSPEGQVQYGDELAYTLVISGVSGTEVGVYDPLTSTTFVRFLEQPAGIAYADHAITGTMMITPTNQTTVSFVAQVNVPGTVGIYADVSNTACVYPAGKTISSCVWSNTTINQAYRPYTVFLPLVVRTQ